MELDSVGRCKREHFRQKEGHVHRLSVCVSVCVEGRIGESE